MTKSLSFAQSDLIAPKLRSSKWVCLKILFILWGIVNSSNTFGQAITIKELEKFCTYSAVDIVSPMVDKGFLSIPLDGREWSWWKAIVKNNKTEIQEMIDKGQSKSLPTIEYSLASKISYQRLRTSITNSGYEFMKNMVASDGTPMEVYFNRKGFLIQFYSSSIDGQVYYTTYLKNTPPYDGDD